MLRALVVGEGQRMAEDDLAVVGPDLEVARARRAG